MVLTPTYHVFHMYRYHQGAELVQSSLQGTSLTGTKADQVTDVHQSVSVDGQGRLTVTLANVALKEAKEIEILLTERRPEHPEAVLLSGAVTSHNTFDEPDVVKEEAFDRFEVTERGLKFTLPPCSVMTIRM